MRVDEVIRRRFMRDDLSVRLGGIAANLARIHSFSDRVEHEDVVASIVNESRYFIEWTAPYIKLEQQVQLVDLQRRLCDWQLSWTQLWATEQRRRAMASESKSWSERVLRMSGLLDS